MGLQQGATHIHVAIIGSGPSAFYAAQDLLKHPDLVAEIDMYERLPTPYGLVRGGVAPDHPKIKSVTKVYDRVAAHERFRFFGNVAFGTDITHDELASHYHAIIYAVGAQTDRRLAIPGEDLDNIHGAAEFVGWYNGHPDYRDLKFDLSQERVAVIGNGNVAADIARIRAHSVDELRATDIADHALQALAESKVKDILILGRRGPVQAKFTSTELRELGQLPQADIVIDPEELILDPLSEDYLHSGSSRVATTNYEILTQLSQKPLHNHNRRIIMRFLVSPVEFLGKDRVEAIRVVKNEICDRGHFMSPCPTEEFETIPAGLVFRSIGYHGVPLTGVPFDIDRGIIPNKRGRVINEHGERIHGEYVVGWIKRGPQGIIGTNKPDAQETITQLAKDMAYHQHLCPSAPSREAPVDILRARGVRFITFEEWKKLDQMEIERGKAIGRPRLKFTRIEEMIEALERSTSMAAAD